MSGMLGVFPAPCATFTIPDEVFERVAERWPEFENERLVFRMRANVPTPIEELAQAHKDKDPDGLEIPVARNPSNGRRYPVEKLLRESEKSEGWSQCLKKVEYFQHSWRKCHTLRYWIWYSDPTVKEWTKL